MKIDELQKKLGNNIVPRQWRQLAQSFDALADNIYENLEMASRNANCFRDVLYSSDTVSIHSHDFYEIALCESGSGQHLIRNHLYPIQKGDIIIIPPGVRHCPTSLHSMTEPYQRIILWLSVPFLENCFSFWPNEEKHRELLNQPRHFRTLGTSYEKLWEYFESSIIESDFSNPYSDSFVCGISLCLLTRLLEATDSSQNVIVKSRKNLIDNIIAYVDRNLNQKITIKSVAAHFHMSKGSLTNLFYHTLNCSFHDYVVQSRLDEAQKLLQKDITLDMIAEMVGFGDYSNFYRTFKKKYGISPSEYRSTITLLNGTFPEQKTKLTPLNCTFFSP